MFSGTPVLKYIINGIIINQLVCLGFGVWVWRGGGWLLFLKIL